MIDKLNNKKMEDIYYHIFSLCNPIDIVIFSHVCKLWLKLTKSLTRPMDIMYDAIYHYNDNVCKWLLKYNYYKSEASLNVAVENNRFDLLLYFDNYSINTVLYSIKSNNVNMVKFIIKKMRGYYSILPEMMNVIFENDNLDIFKCFDENIIVDRYIIKNLVHYCSINIIEYIRFRVINRNLFEKQIRLYANITFNDYMINYCNDNDYGNH